MTRERRFAHAAKAAIVVGAFAMLLAAPVLHAATVLGGILSPAPGASLYEADQGTNSVMTFTPAGVQSTFATGFTFPNGVAFDALGNLYVSDSAGNIYKITPQGVQSTFTNLPGANPQALAFDAAGNLYAAGFSASKVFKITPAGTASPFVSGLIEPNGLAFDAAGNLYVSDSLASQVLEYSPTGTLLNTIIVGLIRPVGLALDAAGNLYVADQTNGVVFEYSPTGAPITIFASVPKATGLAFDSFGNLYVSDSRPLSGSIFKFSPTGAPLGTFATGLNVPEFLAFGPVLNMQLRYTTHIQSGFDGDFVNITNDGSSGGNLCVGVYFFDPNEELQSCCACEVTPNGLISLSVKANNANNLTSEFPDSEVVKLLAWSATSTATATGTLFGPGSPIQATPGASICNAANPGPALAVSMHAWGTDLHTVPGGFSLTETPFSPANLGKFEYSRLTNFCSYNQFAGSGNYGQCKGCQSAGLGAAAAQ